MAAGHRRQHYPLRRLPGRRRRPRQRRASRSGSTPSLPSGSPARCSGWWRCPAERDRLRELALAAPGICWDRLLFSAKESVYKAWFPLAGRWLGFADADITINAADGTFEARLLVAPPESSGVPLAGFTGRWVIAEGMILTAITVLA